MLAAHVRLMAQYNAWMNERLYAVCATLPDEERKRDRQAFFGSIHATLNHILAGDTIWMQRFATHPAYAAALAPVAALTSPYKLDSELFADFDALARHRAWFDAQVLAWAETVADADLAADLTYTNRAGETFRRDFFGLVMHFFNHQTHHRGQVTTLLSQRGLDVGVTDLVALIPDLKDEHA